MNSSDISSLVKLRFWQHKDEGGTLTVIPDNGEASLGMAIKRVFSVTGVPKGGVRGDHAHRFCTQVVVCLHGRVTIKVDDGRDKSTTVLNKAEDGLLIPPGLWNHLTFDGPDTVIVVFCDQLYDPADYLRDRDEYQRYKGVGHGSR